MHPMSTTEPPALWAATELYSLHVWVPRRSLIIALPPSPASSRHCSWQERRGWRRGPGKTHSPRPQARPGHGRAASLGGLAGTLRVAVVGAAARGSFQKSPPHLQAGSSCSVWDVQDALSTPHRPWSWRPAPSSGERRGRGGIPGAGPGRGWSSEGDSRGPGLPPSPHSCQWAKPGRAGETPEQGGRAEGGGLGGQRVASSRAVEQRGSAAAPAAALPALGLRRSHVAEQVACPARPHA